MQEKTLHAVPSRNHVPKRIKHSSYRIMQWQKVMQGLQKAIVSYFQKCSVIRKGDHFRYWLHYKSKSNFFIEIWKEENLLLMIVDFCIWFFKILYIFYFCFLKHTNNKIKNHTMMAFNISFICFFLIYKKEISYI